MIYYDVYLCQGLFIAQQELSVADPFALTAAQIVQIVLSAGFTPEVHYPKAQPYRDAMAVVMRKHQTFLVFSDAELERLVVQEAQDDLYDLC